MNFLENIFVNLAAAGETPVLRELHDQEVKGVLSCGVTGPGLLKLVAQARAFLAGRSLRRGERCALLANNSIEWVAMDLAIMAEGLIVVPLYARQAPSELVSMMKDCSPSLICCGDAMLRDAIAKEWTEAPPQVLFEDIFGGKAADNDIASRVGAPAPPKNSRPHSPSDPVAIIYTSGTSGEAKGVVLNTGNVGHMLSCTSTWLPESKSGQDRVFHYLPFCFAGSWIMLLTSLLLRNLLILNTDLARLPGDMRSAAPDYFLNVPALLERMRKAVDEQLGKTGAVALSIYSHAKDAWVRKHEKREGMIDSLWLNLARAIVFPTIRKKMIGSNLKALICGSAPLNMDTQLYFMMLGIPVLQVYGLTETTAICTMDDPGHIEAGRVGPAIKGVEMKLGGDEEIIVRGPNIFPGYWNRPAETARVLHDGWFHTGDQGELDAAGNWRIIGRIKNLIILGSGHNIPPEPIEEELLKNIAGAQQVVLMGNGRGYLSAIITGNVSRDAVQSALDILNPAFPHYKQVRTFHISQEAFSVDNGLLTANGKLKRDLIAERMKAEIEGLYPVKQAS